MSAASDRLRDFFLEASALGEREAGPLLDRACAGDEALRKLLEELLQHVVSAPSQIGESATRLAIPDAVAPTIARALALPPSGAPVLGARYRVLGELGAGSFGVVERLYDRSLRRIVAAKSPRVPGLHIEQTLLREARLLAYLDHPGAVQVYDLREDDAGVSYTMELIEGESLAERLRSLRAAGRKMSISEALRVVTRVCETLANAHHKGIVHLDVKPDNVMLQGYGRVSVIDWGIARFHDEAPYRAHIEHAGAVDHGDLMATTIRGGTPLYMSPEQFTEDAALGPPSDIYAVGSMLFELLAGRCPFSTSATMAALRDAKLAGSPSLRSLRPEVSDRLEAICMRMLAPTPRARPQSLDAVLDELARLADIGDGTEIIRLAAGEVLFEQGAESNTAYQIVEGQLEVVVDDDGPRVVATRGAGEIVGELAMLSRARRSATVRAGPATVLRALDWRALEHELSRVDPMVAHLLRNLSDKLIETI